MIVANLIDDFHLISIHQQKVFDENERVNFEVSKPSRFFFFLFYQNSLQTKAYLTFCLLCNDVYRFIHLSLMHLCKSLNF